MRITSISRSRGMRANHTLGYGRGKRRSKKGRRSGRQTRERRRSDRRTQQRNDKQKTKRRAREGKVKGGRRERDRGVKGANEEKERAQSEQEATKEGEREKRKPSNPTVDIVNFFMHRHVPIIKDTRTSAIIQQTLTMAVLTASARALGFPTSRFSTTTFLIILDLIRFFGSLSIIGGFGLLAHM